MNKKVSTTERCMPTRVKEHVLGYRWCSTGGQAYLCQLVVEHQRLPVVLPVTVTIGLYIVQLLLQVAQLG